MAAISTLMTYPLVTIIIPVYNAEKYIEQTINSAINQTWPNKEIIVVDDGSTDGSLKMAQKFVAENIKIITQKNQGASVARNTGLKEAKGEYIQFLDADDILTPNKIEAQMLVLNGSKTHVALCKTVHFFDWENYQQGIVMTNWYDQDSNNPVDFLLKLYAGNETMPGYGGMIQPNAWLTPTKLIEKAGMWNEFRCPDDDGEFFCRVVLASEGIRYCEEGLNYYRKFKSGGSLSGSKSLKAFENIVLAIDLKYSYLKKRTNNSIVDRIFAKHYWYTGLMAYPQYKRLSDNCIKKAKKLGYNGVRYEGGYFGRLFAFFLGWKSVKFISYYKQLIKMSLIRNAT